MRLLCVAFCLSGLFLLTWKAAAQPPRPISVQEALQDAAGNGIPLRLGQTVALVGVLTSDSLILGPEASLTHLQDSTGGIQLFTTDPLRLIGHFQRGDLVEVRGRLKQYKGMDELLIEDIHRLGKGRLPAPREVQAADLNSRRYQGQLVRMVGQLRVPHDFGRIRSCELHDASGQIAISLPSKLLQNPRFLARLLDGGEVEVVGIAGQVKDPLLDVHGYRLMPRDTDDFHFPFAPPYRVMTVFLCLVLLLGVLVHLWFQRRSAEQRVRSAEALRVSEEKFARAFRSSPDAITISGLDDGVYLDVNDGFLRLTGHQRDEVVGHTVTELGLWVDPASRSTLIQRLRDHGRVSNLEAKFRTKSEETGIGLVSAELIILRGRACMLTVVRDITGRKEAEKKLEERTAYLNALLESNPLAIVIHDPQNRVLMCNLAFERLFLYRQAEILGAKLDDLIKSEETPAEAEQITRRVLAGETVRVTTRRRRKDGVLVDVELHAVPLIVHGALVAAYGLYQDITDRIVLEDQLRRSQKMEALGRLTGGVAHDFNNVIMVIKGHADLLRERLPPAVPQHRNAEQIQKTAERASSLIQQLLAYSREQVSEPRILDLNEVLIEIGKMLPRLIGEDIEMVVRPSSSLGRVKADPGQIQQVLMNLALNSRDAMPKGGKLIIETGNIHLGDDYARQHAGVEPGRYVVLAVSDTGCGMDAETQAHIFEPFFTTKAKGKGAGLGLATVFGIVKQSGGHISVYSEPGVGTTFKVYLPRIEEAVQEIYAEKASSLQGTGTVMLVEDDEAVRELVRGSLERYGYTVLEASDAARAVQIADNYPGPIRLIVTDVVMPGISGRELVERLAPERPEMKVLYMSGYTESAIAHHGVLDPQTAFIQKPFRPADLARRVSELLAVQSPAVGSQK